MQFATGSLLGLSRAGGFIQRAMSRLSSSAGSVTNTEQQVDNTPMVSLVVDQDDQAGDGGTAAVGTGITEYHYVFRTTNARARKTVEQVAWEWHIARYDPKLDIEHRDKYGPKQLRFLFAVRGGAVGVVARVIALCVDSNDCTSNRGVVPA